MFWTLFQKYCSCSSSIIFLEDFQYHLISLNTFFKQTFHLRATNEVERQKWVTALELAKAKALQVRYSDTSSQFRVHLILLYYHADKSSEKQRKIEWIES